MKRGEVWVAAGKEYARKFRPAVVVQDDQFDATDSITICPFTSDPTESPKMRIIIEPSEANGLKVQSRLMVDKITTVPRHKLSRQIGRLPEQEMAKLSSAMAVFLGLAG